MTQAMGKNDLMLERFKQLSAEQQQSVLDFMGFLLFQSQSGEEKTEKELISAYEAAKYFAGCLDGGPSDLSVNKEYLKGMGQ
jgi:hypothetical protein